MPSYKRATSYNSRFVWLCVFMFCQLVLSLGFFWHNFYYITHQQQRLWEGGRSSKLLVSSQKVTTININIHACRKPEMFIRFNHNMFKHVVYVMCHIAKFMLVLIHLGFFCCHLQLVLIRL